ncbi:MAG: conjugal transfer protein TraL [Oscillospiraceae bacterium]|nr:conjugal transfer protein TraL [Oscillospiraceae bacterium]
MSDKTSLSAETVKSCIVPAAALFAAAFFVSRCLSRAGTGDAFFIAAVLSLCGLTLTFVLRRRLTPAFSALIMLLLLARLFFFDTQTSDYTDFLHPWTEYMRAHGHFAALGESFANYNVPYMVFLALCSCVDFFDLYLIKLLSVIFDAGLAAVLCLLTGLFSSSRVRGGLAAVLALALPTVFINGAVWGQCDGIYAFWALFALYLCLSGHPVLSMLSLGLSFAFKLQAVFIMPAFLPMLFRGKLKLRHLPVFPAAYTAAVSPAVFAGRGIKDALLFYVSTASTAGSALNYNSPSMYSLPCFFSPADPSSAALAGVAAAFALCAAVFALFFIRRKKITRLSLLFAAVFFCISIPALLPHMHERYFYMCELLVLTAALVCPVFAPAAALVQFAALLGYYAYFKMRYLLPMRFGFAALLPVLLLSGGMLCYSLLRRREDNDRLR